MKDRMDGKRAGAGVGKRVTQSVSIGKSYGEQSFNNMPLSRARHKILLIHGRDELNVLRLQKAIHDKWRFTVVTLTDLPASGRTIFEKFEQEAIGAVYAVALLTPDDSVEFGGEQYRQARPNVTLELGWLYGRLGRSRVCILVQRGTHLPSDLHGINRIDFAHNVLDAFPQLQAELESVGMLKSA